MKSILIFIILIVFPHVLYSQENEEQSLIVTCKENLHVKRDNLKIEVVYVNSTKDTIVLPIRDSNADDFYSLHFADGEVTCGVICDWLWPRKELNENISSLKYDGYKILLPFKSYKQILTFNKLGCYKWDSELFKKGKKYEYYIVFEVTEKFKLYSKKVWTGKTKSKIGSIIID